MIYCAHVSLQLWKGRGVFFNFLEYFALILILVTIGAIHELKLI